MPTFFDLMPNDVHDRIAHYLLSFTKSKYIEDYYSGTCAKDSIADDKLLDTLLDYARSSPAQCRSILRAMSKHLHITEDWRSQRVVDWISVSAKYLQSLEMSEAPRFFFPSGSPRLPKLERAVITMLPEHISLIHGSPKLKDLTIFLYDTHRWDSLVSTVGSLPLEALQLHFFPSQLAKNLSRIEIMSLRAACPFVAVLFLDADYPLNPAFWDMIKGMRSLKKLKGVAPFEDEQVPFLRSLQDIALVDVFETEWAIPLGPALTHLEFYQAYDEEILRLQLLPNLSSLKISLEPGHERALVGMIPNVKELTLSWNYKDFNHRFQISHGSTLIREHPLYHEPDGRVLEEILRSTRHLKSLNIHSALLSSDVVAGLLKIAGGKLEKFEVCHDWQKESVPERMESILKGIARYCLNLETLSFLETLHLDFRQGLPIFATEEQRKMCFRALEEVSDSVPGFKSFRHVTSTILHRFTQDQSELMTWQHMLEEDRACILEE